MDLHKRVIVLFALAVMLSLAAATLSPGAVQAEGEVPEAPELVEPPAAEEGLPPEGGVQDAVQALAESGSVLVQEGEGVPMVSQAALQILCKPDPWFYGACLGGKCPYETITLALADWVNKAGTGFIFLEGGYNPVSESLNINGIDYENLKGIVWDTTTGGAKPIIPGFLDVYNFSSGFTLQGLDIRYNGALYPMGLQNNTGLFRLIDVDVTTTNPASAGFQMWNNGPVEILRVNAGGSGYGVLIDTCGLSGSTCTKSGSVKITNSSFNDTAGATALTIRANGPVTLSGVSSSYNGGNGVVLASAGAVVIKNSVFAYNRTGDTNWGFGLYIDPATKGSVTMENVVFTNNSNHGAFISTAGNVTLKNVTASLNKKGIMIAASKSGGSGAGALNVSVLNGVFHDNGTISLWVESKGTITLTNIFSSSPGEYGLNLDNTYAVAAPGVTIKNASLLANGVGGGVVKSKGSIIIDSINVPSSPLSYGLDLDNRGGPGSVTLNSTLFQNYFAGAKFAGLRIQTSRNVLLNNVLSEWNGASGIDVWAEPSTGSVTLKNVTANSNGEWGVVVRTNGAISWIKGGASENGLNDTDLMYAGGADLSNAGALETAPRPVTVSGLALNGNLENVGLFIATRGSVNLTSITADDNLMDGIKVNKYAGAGSIYANLIHTVGNDIIGLNIYQEPGDSRSVNVSLNNITANENGRWGMWIETNGAISWAKGEASNNGQVAGLAGGGVYIRNNSAAEIAAKPVTLRDIKLNSNLKNNGVSILTRGAVTITNAQISGHTDHTGLYINKGTGIGNILLTNISADGNQYGIDITATSTVNRYNNVTLINVSASNNGSSGILVNVNGNISWAGGAVLNNVKDGGQNSVVLYNYEHILPATPFGVKISNVTISNPNGFGLVITSYGAVTLSGVNASNHKDYGAMLNTCGGSSDVSCTNTYLAPVTVLKSTFTGAYGVPGVAGLHIHASGAVTLSGVIANNNSGKGVYINNHIGTLLAKPVTVTSSTFNNNFIGATIESDGAILLNSVTASMNRNYEGLNAVNNSALAPRAVTITGVNNFNANKTTGLFVMSKGQITVSGVRSSTNGQMGIYLNSDLAGVSLGSSLVEGNGSDGVYISSHANVLVNTLNSFYNGWDDGYNGITIEAYVPPGTTPPFVTISNSNFLGNKYYGILLYVDDEGEIKDHYKFINVAAFGNMLDDIIVSD